MTQPNSDLAYIFTPAKRPTNPGHPRLIIHLLSSPTGEHFDPQQVLIPVISPSGEQGSLKLVHPWQGLNDYPMVPGRVILHDRAGKTAEAFTFGAGLHIESSPARTLCQITSDAPILNLAAGQKAIELLAEEVEILLAEENARWSQNPDSFYQKLSKLKPLDFYSSCLVTLREKLKHMLVVEDSPLQKLNHLIAAEARYMENTSVTSHPRPLSDLFNSL